jgi:NAD-dependent DNA ligase
MTVRREGNPESTLYGEVIVFTGRLGVPRWKAVAIASDIGCRVSSAVTKKTTLLVEGSQDAGQSTLSNFTKDRGGFVLPVS